MATIVRLGPASTLTAGERWRAIADGITRWASVEDVPLRDAVVLLPFVQLLPLARAAFASIGGWMPRIETTRTLAASLGPAPVAQAGQLSLDPTLDALGAAALLRSQAWGAAWARRDARGFEQAAAALVATAHELVHAAAAVPVALRPAHWGAARALLMPVAGPGATERLLARVALEWACLAPPPATDRLFERVVPSAWIAVQAGGADPLTARLMQDTVAPCLVIDTDADPDDPFIGVMPMHAPAHVPTFAPAFALCEGFEHEAQCAAAQVLAHLRRGESPVALIAQDRVLVRRVRALLQREPLRLLDETGWKLSTTRAAARVMALLTAARPDAGTDALLDWLKAGTAWAQADGGAALDALEAACRRGQIARVAGLQHATLEPAASELRARASGTLAQLFSSRSHSLARWLEALTTALASCGALGTLQSDDAGRQVIAALRLMPGAGDQGSEGAWPLLAQQATMGFDAFRGWVDAALERAAFLPSPGFDGAAQVVITPLARAMLRPWAAVVFPGVDDKRLGGAVASPSVLSDALAAKLGVPTAAGRRSAEALAFVQLLAVPHLTFTRRRLDGPDPLADSPLIERLASALAASGRSLAVWADPRVALQIPPTPICRSAPSAPGLLPARLSASACEALRACPYRFFALNLLRLREHDEIEREVEKRDYGTWLHAVLFAFHSQRGEPAAADVEIAQLTALAAAGRLEQGLSDADFLPFDASFASFAPRYIAWLHARDLNGARWLSGEDDISTRPEALGGTELRGIVDRIDEIRRGAGTAIELIDYKTGGATGLREKTRQPFEDTQLAFYAALVRTRTELPLVAGYLALDGTHALESVPHEGVEASAAALVAGLAHDLRRLRAGAGLPALGEGATCMHCAARGLCRRDHWTVDDGVPP